ncbi:unnamed protein product [Adineta ricciae]|uniref:Uncharacterized protein n=1 Tax=Adineta ricciae TaxID=249248 RepID=A0A814U126_ADIRI|nr:unnamed protein product [Adineta ricciae]
MISTTLVLFVAILPSVSSSPTPSSIPHQSINTMNENSEALMYDSLASAPSSPLASVHEQKISAPSSSVWFGQPRMHANQFLMSHANDVIVPKWFTQFSQDADSDDDYASSSVSFNKRSSFYNAGGQQTLKKRKQLNKPPMEVMNEIVNSIYLKR